MPDTMTLNCYGPYFTPDYMPEPVTSEVDLGHQLVNATWIIGTYTAAKYEDELRQLLGSAPDSEIMLEGEPEYDWVIDGGRLLFPLDTAVMLAAKLGNMDALDRLIQELMKPSEPDPASIHAAAVALIADTARQVNEQARVYAARVRVDIEVPNRVGRPVKFTTDQVFRLLDARQQGKTLAQCREASGISPGVVNSILYAGARTTCVEAWESARGIPAPIKSRG